MENQNISIQENKKGGSNKVLLAFLIFFILLSLGLGYYLTCTLYPDLRICDDGMIDDRGLNPRLKDSKEEIKENKKLNIDIFSKSFENQNKEFKLLNEDLGILNMGTKDGIPSAEYYQAGVFLEGELEGYTRIIARSIGPMGTGEVFIFATKDFNEYIGDSSNSLTENNYKEHDELLIGNITRWMDFEAEHPDEIILDDIFVLYPLGIQFISDEVLVKLPEREIEYGNLSFHYIKEDKFDSGIALGTIVSVLDSSELPMAYTMSYIEKEINIDKKNSSLYLNSKEIIRANAGQDFFNHYGYPFVERCVTGFFNIGRILDVSENELDIVGTAYGLDLYSLKEKDHSLNKLLYEHTSYLKGDVQEPPFFEPEYLIYPQHNLSYDDYVKSLPSNYDEYISKNPLLFFQDPWDRWVTLGTVDFHQIGACGPHYRFGL